MKWKIARLHRAGKTLGDCVERAGVSYRMGQFWAAGTRRSARLDAAFKEMTASGPSGGGGERALPRSSSPDSPRQTRVAAPVFDRAAAHGRAA
jgi:hypothetical protein